MGTIVNPARILGFALLFSVFLFSYCKRPAVEDKATAAHIETAAKNGAATHNQHNPSETVSTPKEGASPVVTVQETNKTVETPTAEKPPVKKTQPVEKRQPKPAPPAVPAAVEVSRDTPGSSPSPSDPVSAEAKPAETATSERTPPAVRVSNVNAETEERAISAISPAEEPSAVNGETASPDVVPSGEIRDSVGNAGLPAPVEETAETPAAPTNEGQPSTGEASPTNTSTNSGTDNPTNPAPPATNEETPVAEPQPAPPATPLENLPDIQPMSCSDPNLGFNDYILAVAKNFEKQKIGYNSIPLSDCSGMFHRLAIAIKDFCPVYRYPDHEEARDTRSLARWYYDNNNLVIIQDAASSGHLIRPGSVMFFGNSEVKYTNITIDKIAVKGGIEHMGTVVAVEKDADGNVTGYTMFHGRNPRKPAGTTQQYLKNRNNKVPPFGNWTQQWVAVANIATQ